MVFKENVFPDLVTLLEDEDAEVRANAAGALMNSAVTTQGECGRGAQPILRRREGGGPPRDTAGQAPGLHLRCFLLTIFSGDFIYSSENKYNFKKCKET